MCDEFRITLPGRENVLKGKQTSKMFPCKQLQSFLFKCSSDAFVKHHSLLVFNDALNLVHRMIEMQSAQAQGDVHPLCSPCPLLSICDCKKIMWLMVNDLLWGGVLNYNLPRPFRCFHVQDSKEVPAECRNSYRLSWVLDKAWAGM